MDHRYTNLDRPEVLASVFHPRPEVGPEPNGTPISDHLIAVAPDIHIGARFHSSSSTGANLLFFHGNGEIVADYDDLGHQYGRSDINFLPVDYRGYGRSNGIPSVSAMMTDCHAIFDYTRQWLVRENHTGPLIIMGRSLGSASALELAAAYKDDVNGLIIESGFAKTLPLLKRLGVDPDVLGLSETDGFANIEKIGRFTNPTLIIHGEFDHIIPYADGMSLYKASAAQDKSLLKIDGANHNDILLRGFDSYTLAVERLVARVQSHSQRP